MSASSTVAVLREESFAIFDVANLQFKLNMALLQACATVLF